MAQIESIRARSNAPPSLVHHFLPLPSKDFSPCSLTISLSDLSLTYSSRSQREVFPIANEKARKKWKDVFIKSLPTSVQPLFFFPGQYILAHQQQPVCQNMVHSENPDYYFTIVHLITRPKAMSATKTQNQLIHFVFHTFFLPA